MKIEFLIFFSICFFANAQEKNENGLNLPVDKFKSYENCCLKSCNILTGLKGMINPIENELRIYGYENESNVFAYKSGIVKKIIKNDYDKSETILIKSDELFFVYKNLMNINVKENDEVIKNQKLGKILTIGNENYLGFEIWNNKAKQLNPIEYLKNNKL
ncbi:peptidoglycan DD-metalloendopeptidase family protein [Soonwooa purpurea]